MVVHPPATCLHATPLPGCICDDRLAPHCVPLPRVQPSMDIFEAFDELLVLKPGGVCVYFGPLGWESQSLIAYFQVGREGSWGRLGCVCVCVCVFGGGRETK